MTIRTLNTWAPGVDLWTAVAAILGALAALSLTSWPEVYVQQGETAPGLSAKLAVPVSPMTWSAEIESKGPAVLAVRCGEVTVMHPAPVKVLVKDDPETECSARVLATGPGVARWTVTTRREKKR
jgi:hypothetical protein